MKTVIFACVQSAGRSQMAAAWFNLLAASDRARATAAGTRPAEQVHPVVVEAMREVGIDLSEAQPRLLTDELVRAASMLVTMGCGESCPIVPEWVRRSDWELEDPKGLPVEQVRPIRDQIKRRVEALLVEQGWR